MFSDDILSFLSMLFYDVVELFSITIPGTNITFLQLGLGVMAFTVVVSIARNLLDWGTGVIPLGKDVFYNAGGNSKTLQRKYVKDWRKNA